MFVLTDKIKIIPSAIYVGVKVVWSFAKMNRKAGKAHRVFERTLKKEGLPPEIIRLLGEHYREAAPSPRNLIGRFLS